MCYSIPGRVVSIDGRTIIIDYFGEQRRAVNEISNLKVGDYIYAQGGYVIDAVPDAEAQEVLALWKELFFELQERDQHLSGFKRMDKRAGDRLSLILERIVADEEEVAEEELLYLLNLEGKEDIARLMQAANYLRHKHLGNSCCIHGIIEFSNYCRQSCGYCGISARNKGLKPYRMTPEEVVKAACEAIDKYGFKALVLQSGEDSAYSIDNLCQIVSGIREREPALIFVSCGEVGLPGLQRLYEAGARGLLMRFETSNSRLYEQLHPGRRLDSRLEHLRAAFDMGYLLITGGLIGLPGQTREDILGDISLTKSLQAEMYSFGPFIPHPGTPLANSHSPAAAEVLKALAVARIVDARNAKIVVTTSFETLEKDARRQGLSAGANSVMISLTPDALRREYTLYPDRAHLNESLENQISDLLEILSDLGRAPTDIGVSHTAS